MSRTFRTHTPLESRLVEHALLLARQLPATAAAAPAGWREMRRSAVAERGRGAPASGRDDREQRRRPPVGGGPHPPAPGKGRRAGAVRGPARAETFLATITKVDGDKVTHMRATYHADKVGTEKYTHDDPVTTVVVKDVAVTRGHFPPIAGDTATDGRLTGKTIPLKDGLDNAAFKTINAGKTTRPSLITVADKGDDKGKITAINLWSSGSPK